MTRSTQKQNEEAVLLELIRVAEIGYVSYEGGETPDFIVRAADRSIGIEVTMFQSKERRGDHCKRLVEAAWEELGRLWCSLDCDISVLLRFINAIPAQQERLDFLKEIVMFIGSKRSVISDRFQLFWRDEFSFPLMSKYLWAIGLAQYDHGSFNSNLTAGFLDPRPAETIATIVSRKSGKKFRDVNELWLVIYSSGRPSEMVLPINGVSELDTCPSSRKRLRLAASRGFLFSPL